MSDVVIRVEGLGKKYRLGANAGPSYRTMRESLMEAGTAPIQKFTRLVGRQPLNGERGRRPEFWALKDVNFEVNRGEVLGIIGRNGAGKSTLLKILSQITEPTEGQVRMEGRVASLLEVGTGFHPELTGRENVYLNGAILGMGKAEIARKFDEIVAFAEVEKFIDTPVKHYSSGMYLRLAFAVSAHLEPEILIVDEVLAVGDAAFQKRCLSKMGEVASHGRTVLFVSHNVAAVTRLSKRIAWIDGGRTRMLGAAGSVVRAYLAHDEENRGERAWSVREEMPGDERVRLRAVRVNNVGAPRGAVIDIREPIEVHIEYELLARLSPRICLTLVSADGTVILTSADSTDNCVNRSRSAGTYVSICQLPGQFLNEGTYSLTVAADIPWVERFFLCEHVLSFQVEQTGGPSGGFGEHWPGLICPTLRWSVRPAAHA